MNQPDVVFFDCDHTVIDTDCEWTWINMLADMGRVSEHYREKQKKYIDLHAKGLTPEREYLDFILQEFVGQTPDSMRQLAQGNFENYIRDKIFAGAREEISKHQDRQIPVVLLSGSTRIMVTPIAGAMGFNDIACTELELIDGIYSGNIVGPFCIREGKLKRGQDYCEQRGMNFGNAIYYGDSISDLQIFEKIGFPVVVNPNSKLAEIAIHKHWAIENW
jgi:HAD superfamily hydrolase (TIGR01490 family)